MVIAIALLLVAADSAFTSDTHEKSFTDELNRTVMVNSPPKRIVSLAPNITEILFKLGLSDELIGVTRECNFPLAAKSKIRVGDYMSVNLELLVSLEPDLIIVSAEGNLKGQIARLERLSLPVYVVKTKMIEDMLATIINIGDVTGKGEEGRALSKSVRDEIDAVKKKIEGAKSKTVFCAVGIEPLIGAGPDTLIGDVIKTSGGINIIAEGGPDYPVINIEELYLKDPDVILVSSMGSEVAKSDSPVMERFSKLNAAKRGDIYMIDADILCRASYRLVDAIKEVAVKLHPDRFEQVSH